MTNIERHMAETYVRPVIMVTCDIKPTVHALRPGCIKYNFWNVKNVTKEPYPHNIAEDDDMYYEDWSKDTDQQFGKPGHLNWWIIGPFLVACVVLLWALHQINK